MYGEHLKNVLSATFEHTVRVGLTRGHCAVHYCRLLSDGLLWWEGSTQPPLSLADAPGPLSRVYFGARRSLKFSRYQRQTPGFNSEAQG